MPAIKRYTVTQSRQVTVWANTLEDAVTIAEGEFARENELSARKLHKANGTLGRVVSPVEETHITVEKL
jgi:hypothetical protein